MAPNFFMLLPLKGRDLYPHSLESVLALCFDYSNIMKMTPCQLLCPILKRLAASSSSYEHSLMKS